MFVSKKDIKRVLVEKKLITATVFNNLSQKGSWKKSMNKRFDAVLEAFGLLSENKKELINRRTSLLRCLNSKDRHGVDFETSRDRSMETSYCESEEECSEEPTAIDPDFDNPLLDFDEPESSLNNSTMSIDESSSIDPKELKIQGKCYLRLKKSPKIKLF